MIPSLSLAANWITRMQQVRVNCRSYRHLEMQQPQQQQNGRRPHNAPAGVVIDSKMQLVLWFAGLRGAMSFALVENIPLYDAVTGEGTRLKSELKAMTSASIIFTVFILGGCTYYMMESLGIAPNIQNTNAKNSTLEKEMEMMGLLSKRARMDSDEEGDKIYEPGPTMTVSSSFLKDGQAPVQGTTFRQRILIGEKDLSD